VSCYLWQHFSEIWLVTEISPIIRHLATHRTLYQKLYILYLELLILNIDFLTRFRKLRFATRSCDRDSHHARESTSILGFPRLNGRTCFTSSAFIPLSNLSPPPTVVSRYNEYDFKQQDRYLPSQYFRAFSNADIDFLFFRVGQHNFFQRTNKVTTVHH
jgi:hypothetical protein